MPKMPGRRVLFFDNARLSAYRVQRGTVLYEAGFTNDEAGLAAFDNYLEQHQHSLFMMLVDTAEEVFKAENVPHSTGKDRQSLLRRRLIQRFHGMPYALACSQGRLKTGRRDERLLLMALTQPQHFESWLAALRNRQAILVGLYSLPQIIHSLLPTGQTGKLLLLTLTCAGLRQTFFDDGRVRFSRLTPLIHHSTDAFARTAASEAIKMHPYLASQRLIERDKPLTTRLLVHPAEAAAIRTHCHSNTSLHFEIVDLPGEARRAGLRSVPGDSRADGLFCHLLVKKTPVEQFAQAGELGPYRLWKTRVGLHTAGTLVLASALLFATYRGLELMQMQDGTAQAQQQIRINQEQYAAKMQALPKIPISTESLRTLIDRYEQVALRAQGPMPLLAQISRSLDAFPLITIDRIEWAIVEQITPPDTHASTAMQSQTSISSHLMTGPYAQAIVSARLPVAMVGEHRKLLSTITEFARHLGHPPDTWVDILEQPVDTQSGKALKSSDESSVDAPRLVFRVTRKL